MLFSSCDLLKFMFSKKVQKIDEIFTVDLIWHYVVVIVKSTVKILSIFVAFLENMNFNFRDPS